ncbi:MAG TPA: hypothetical protein VFL90_14675 [Methylomirabilota bacterium]|nr:hypothetical protein [Methylomirabilota bacterium]
MSPSAAATTLDVEYGFGESEIDATTTHPTAVFTRPLLARRPRAFSRYGSQSEDAVLVETSWEVAPVSRILTIARRCLGPNWDGNQAAAVTREATTAAIDLILQIGTLGLDELPQPYVGAAAAGGYVFEFQSHTRELSLGVFNDSASVTFLKSGQGEPFNEGQIPLGSPVQLRELLAWLISPPA